MKTDDPAKRGKPRLPVRLIQAEPGKAALTALLCLISIASIVVATGLSSQIRDRVARATVVWPGQVWFEQMASESKSGEYLSSTGALTRSDLQEVVTLLGGTDYDQIAVHPRTVVRGILDMPGGLREVQVIGIEPADPLADEPVEVVTGSITIVREDVGTNTQLIPASAILGLTRSGMVLVNAGALWSGVEGTPQATHGVVVLTEIPAIDQSSFGHAFELGALTESIGISARPWQETVGISRFALVARVERLSVLILAAIACAGLVGGTATTVAHRHAMVLTLRIHGFTVESIRGVLARETLILATSGSLLGGIIGYGVVSLIAPGKASGIIPIVLLGCLLPPVLSLAFSGKPLRIAVADLQREVGG